jgi:uroporphyrinogen III methyltransferase/synthase
MAGIVHLVGAGPGDPGLLTLRGRDLLARCEAVVYDYLVNERLLDLVPATTQRVFVGKKGGGAVCTQDDINRHLVELARRGLMVVRLKGGDPFFFGRGGEEARALAAAGVPFTVVPGVTSGVAAPAYAGIPVTDRDESASVAFCTGHERPEKLASAHDWGALARMGTLVWYMAVRGFADIARRLMEHGRDGATPAAAVQWGTWPHQRVIHGRLDDLAERLTAAGVSPPAIIIVGGVARLGEVLAWWDPGPLAGRTLLVPRLSGRGGELVPALEAAGARVLTLDSAPADPDPAPLTAGLAKLPSCAWIAFSSRLGVRRFLDALTAHGHDLRRLAGLGLAAQGANTAAELRSARLEPDLVADGGDGRAFAKRLLAAQATRPGPVLLPGSADGPSTVASTLAAAGVHTERLAVYRQGAAVDFHLAGASIDAVVCLSAGAVARLRSGLGDAGLTALLQRGCRVLAAGQAAGDALADVAASVQRCPTRIPAIISALRELPPRAPDPIP